MMVENGRDACSMKDSKGNLPAHIACSRHCSVEKLKLLLEVNPRALYATTNKGETLITLAHSTATTHHPNHSLIAYLRQRLEQYSPNQGETLEPGVGINSRKRMVESSSRVEAENIEPARKLTMERNSLVDASPVVQEAEDIVPLDTYSSAD